MMRRPGKLGKITVFVFFCVLISFLTPSSSSSDSVFYLYDDLGRLRIVGNSSGNYATYEYDAVGNLLAITNGTTSPTPPVIQGINPDVLFIGSTTTVSITGQNLLMTKTLSANNPLVIAKILNITNTEIKAELMVSSQASAGPVVLTVATFYGSANTSASLVSSQLSFGPALLSLTPGSSGGIKAVIYPPLGNAETIQLKSSDPSVASIPQSVSVPASGAATFTVNALREGVAYISSGTAGMTVYVTAAFTPIAGEQLTNFDRVSVYIDSPSAAPTMSALPVSAYIDSPIVNSALQSVPFSVGTDVPAGSAVTQSPPVSAYINSPSGGSATMSQPISVYIDVPIGISVTQSLPVSAYIDNPSGGSATMTLPVSTYIDGPAGSAIQQSAPASVYIEPALGGTSVSMPVSVKRAP